jgi:hypothetical protein
MSAIYLTFAIPNNKEVCYCVQRNENCTSKEKCNITAATTDFIQTCEQNDNLDIQSISFICNYIDEFAIGYFQVNILAYICQGQLQTYIAEETMALKDVTCSKPVVFSLRCYEIILKFESVIA